MTFTYNSASITTDLAKVRLEIGDTDSADALFTDEEIAAFLADEVTVLRAAARACEVQARKYARDFNWDADGDKVDRVSRAKHYADLAAVLRKRASGTLRSRDTIRQDGNQPSGLERTHTDRLDQPFVE